MPASHGGDVEGIELVKVIVLASALTSQDAAEFEDKSPGIDHEMHLPHLQAATAIQGIPLGPTGAIARDELHAIVLPDVGRRQVSARKLKLGFIYSKHDNKINSI